jgi:hypothetical protein
VPDRLIRKDDRISRAVRAIGRAVANADAGPPRPAWPWRRTRCCGYQLVYLHKVARECLCGTHLPAVSRSGCLTGQPSCGVARVACARPLSPVAFTRMRTPRENIFSLADAHQCMRRSNDRGQVGRWSAAPLRNYEEIRNRSGDEHARN